MSRAQRPNGLTTSTIDRRPACALESFLAWYVILLAILAFIRVVNGVVSGGTA